MAPCLSYVVLTRDRREEVLGCLASLEGQDLPGTETVLVDAGSGDGTVASIRARFPRVRLIEAGRNLGVAGGRNRGMAAAEAPVCLLVDDDARLPDAGSARRVRDAFDRDPRLACLALRIVDASTGKDVRRAVPRADRRLPGDGEECALFCGAGFAVRRQVFLDVGGFWEELHYAGEELDLSYRLLAAGHRLAYAARVPVLHREVADGRPPGQWVYHQARNRGLVAVRSLPGLYAATHTVAWAAFTGGVALRDGHLGPWARGLRDGLRALPTALRERRALDTDTVRRVARLGGRLWY